MFPKNPAQKPEQISIKPTLGFLHLHHRRRQVAMSRIRVDLHRLRSGFRSPSHRAEVCSRLGQSELVSSSTRPNPLSPTLLCLQPPVFAICASEVSETEPRLKLGVSHFAAESVRNNLRCFTKLRNKLIGQPTGSTAVLTKQWYVGVLAHIRINAFRIELAGGLYDDYQDLLSSAKALVEAEVEAEAAVGNAVYMLPSFYNHNCDPNAHIVWIENSDATVKALRDIEAGEELRICYIDASMEHDARQTLLSEGFGFRCQCLRCSLGD